MSFNKGMIPWNKGLTCPNLSGVNNGMFGKGRPDLVIRNKTVSQRNAVIRYNKNRVVSKKTRKLIGESSRTWNLNNTWWKGSKNPGYVNGKSEARKGILWSVYNSWRKDVLGRDNYCCSMCGSKKKLQVHHIVKVVEDISKATDVDNGIVLCSWCHKMTHHPKLRPIGCTVVV